ncbi:hypothetical protein N7931_19255, partial [Catenovulum sp. 2E275]|uniref:hypothetical protein n=1 Tax=Catenovulum sp. 2E275 TaxID=2980497 RepID=UPI0021D2F038
CNTMANYISQTVKHGKVQFDDMLDLTGEHNEKNILEYLKGFNIKYIGTGRYEFSQTTPEF